MEQGRKDQSLELLVVVPSVGVLTGILGDLRSGRQNFLDDLLDYSVLGFVGSGR